ncbi:hypothetical protein P280DRAFT_472403 [Massarina eburnea CBS 473.64]|uniref:Uncharacterized protein n=1 Tax=Massarina eburnea CBS 473.64 TaxID=1395130 RepID=A0A6A6RPS4_9PLEO|nr:hypothetical protein P280DRAFT_472403 [Massarina eburnea CBS 473.64]
MEASLPIIGGAGTWLWLAPNLPTQAGRWKNDGLAAREWECTARSSGRSCSKRQPPEYSNGSRTAVDFTSLLANEPSERTCGSGGFRPWLSAREPLFSNWASCASRRPNNAL